MESLGSRVRALAERYSRGRVLRRRLPAALGGHRLYVSPDAALRFWRPGLNHADETLLSLARELVTPGSSVWDVGANVGLFSFAAAYLAGARGHVLAVEADPWLASLIGRSAMRASSAYARVTALAAAVSDRSGTALFGVAERGRAASHLLAAGGSTQSGGARQVVLVATVPLDALLDVAEAPDLVKIDVEGAELLCLRGAQSLLSSVRPSIICEVGAASRAAVSEMLRTNRYCFFDGSIPKTMREGLAVAPWTCLAIPQERCDGSGAFC